MGENSRKTLVHILTVPESLRFLEGQINYVRQSGYDIHIITSPGSLLDDFANKHNIIAYGIEMPRKITPFNDLIAVWKIWKVLRKVQPDIVHSHTPKGGLLGMISAWLARIPARIYHARGLPFEGSTGKKRSLLKVTERISCTLAHRVFCNSQSNLDVMVAEGLCSSDKITLLHNGSSNGVDATDLFKPFASDDVRIQTRTKLNLPLGATVIGFVGRVVHDKGIDELIEAWKSLREQYLDTRLLFVGRFEDQDVVLPETRQVINTDERIHFADFVTNKSDMPILYAAIDILVLPSHREGLPNVILEAGGMRLPVVSTFASGCRDAVVDGETGLLVPVNDAHALEKALQQYIADPNMRTKHGETGRKRMLADFKPEDIWFSILNEYQNLLYMSKSSRSQDKQSRVKVKNNNV